MIAFFPQTYPDELLYSLLSRYHQRSGNARFVFTAEELYRNGKITHPSIDFVNVFTDDAMNWLTKEKPWEIAAEEHTMFPAYIRFLPLKRRKEAEEGVRSQNGNWKNLMCLPVLNEKRFLRFCPQCAKEDREEYGETYWHRGHQIPRVRVCPKHGTFLENSSIPIGSKTAPGLFDAEGGVPGNTVAKCCENQREIEFTKYVIDVFNIPIDFETDFDIGTYLKLHIPTVYKNKSGLMTDISRFYSDYKAFYNGLPIMPQSYMQKIFNGYIYDTYYILQLAFFEGISAFEISHVTATKVINELDVLYSHLSKKYNIDYTLITEIATEILNHTKHKISNTSGPKRKEYKKLDAELLPKVKTLVDDIIKKQGRPERVTITKIQRLMGLPQKQFNKLPKCKAYIESKGETQEEYWAREVEWAVKEIGRTNRMLSLSRIMKLTNMRKPDVVACIDMVSNPYIRVVVRRLLNI